MNCLDRIRDALLGVSKSVYHFKAPKRKPPYIVWAEDGAGDTLFADGKMEEQVTTGTVDLYTANPENRDLFFAIQAALDDVCAWTLNSIQYEDETGLAHYEWAWEAI